MHVYTKQPFTKLHASSTKTSTPLCVVKYRRVGYNFFKYFEEGLPWNKTNMVAQLSYSSSFPAETSIYFFSHRAILASSQRLDMESLLYKADLDESSLLHLAVDSGVLKVSRISSVYI